jgi:hypothetical protein
VSLLPLCHSSPFTDTRDRLPIDQIRKSNYRRFPETALCHLGSGDYFQNRSTSLHHTSVISYHDSSIVATSHHTRSHKTTLVPITPAHMLSSIALRRTLAASSRATARPATNIHKSIFSSQFFVQTAKMSGTPGKKGVHNLQA